MNYKIETIPNFDKELKRLVKKYRSMKSDMALLIDKLQDNPEMGVLLGDDCYKIRVAIKSKGKREIWWS